MITSDLLPLGTVGAAYSAQLTASGGTPPYVWEVDALPDGLAAGPDGAITGTPTTAGSFPFTATVHDSTGAQASKLVNFLIEGASSESSESSA